LERGRAIALEQAMDMYDRLCGGGGDDDDDDNDDDDDDDNGGGGGGDNMSSAKEESVPYPAANVDTPDLLSVALLRHSLDHVNC
jgi:hypothetical protein